MRTLILATAAVALLAQPAGAATEAKDPRDRQGEPILPGAAPDSATLPGKADRQASPQREAKQAEIRTDLEAWRERIEAWRREHQAYGGEEKAARLDKALRDAEQGWRRLAQADGSAWERELHLFEEAREELSQVWIEANR